MPSLILVQPRETRPYITEMLLMGRKESNQTKQYKICRSTVFNYVGELSSKRGSSVVRHLPLVLEVPGSIPARGENKFGVRTRFL